MKLRCSAQKRQQSKVKHIYLERLTSSFQESHYKRIKPLFELEFVNVLDRHTFDRQLLAQWWGRKWQWQTVGSDSVSTAKKLLFVGRQSWNALSLWWNQLKHTLFITNWLKLTFFFGSQNARQSNFSEWRCEMRHYFYNCFLLAPSRGRLSESMRDYYLPSYTYATHIMLISWFHSCRAACALHDSILAMECIGSI